MIVLLVGPHGAGKTTLGRALADATGWSFHEELGRELAARHEHRPTRVTAQDRQHDFDCAVLAAELARDAEFAATHGTAPRIVETWHPGNLAYAALRSPEVAAGFLSYARTQIDWRRVAVIPIDAPPAVLAARQTERGSPRFFVAVARLTLGIARAFGAREMPLIQTHRSPPGALAQRAAPRLERFLRQIDVSPARSRASLRWPS